MRPVLLLLTLTACSPQANHLGNPLLLPVSGVSTAVHNTTYNARRARVSRNLRDNAQTLRAGGFTGPGMVSLFEIAGTPPENWTKVSTELSGLDPTPDWTERATIIVMVHS